MSELDISLESISALQQANYAQEAQVLVLKKLMQQEANVSSEVIKSATESLPPGKGSLLNTVA